MLYIFLILFIALLFVYRQITANENVSLKDFNLQETLSLRGCWQYVSCLLIYALA